MWQTVAGRWTHIGEEGPPHQGEETRHFESLRRVSTTSRASVWELCLEHGEEGAKLRLHFRQSQKIY